MNLFEENSIFWNIFSYHTYLVSFISLGVILVLFCFGSSSYLEYFLWHTYSVSFIFTWSNFVKFCFVLILNWNEIASGLIGEIQISFKWQIELLCK